jgi:competence protein ComEC
MTMPLLGPGSVASDRTSGFDLRLALGAAVAWLTLLGCRWCAPTVALAVAMVAGVAAAVVVVLGPVSAAPIAAVVGLGAWCVVGILVPYDVRLHQIRRSLPARLAEDRPTVVAELVLTSDPRPIPGGPAGLARLAISTSMRALTVHGGRLATHAPVIAFVPQAGWAGLLPGQRVQADGRLGPSADRLVAAVLSVTRAPVPLGRPPPWQRAAGAVRSGLQEASTVLPGDARGLRPGLVMGDTSSMDPVLSQRFKAAGLTHLVAVSGANLVIVVGAVQLVMRRMRAPPWLGAAVAGLALAGFVIVTRATPSVLRAALMAAIALAAAGAGRPRAGIPLVAAAVLGCLAWRPEWAPDPGFAMSVLATLALLTVAPAWSAALRRRRVPPVVAESLATAAAAHLLTAPIIVMISGRLSLVTVPANMLAEPAVAPATLAGVVAAALAPEWHAGARAAAWVAGWPVRWLVDIADTLGGMSAGSIGWPATAAGAFVLVVVTLSAVAVARTRRLRPALAAAALVALAVQVPVRHLVTAWPPPGWIFAACDVGQGDGLVLPVARHEAVVVDTGPDPVLVDRCLRDLHVTSVPLLVISHLHLDHVGGIDGVLRGRRVNAVITGPLAEPKAGLAVVEHALNPHHLVLRVANVGLQLAIGAVRLTVLAPEVAFRGTRSDPNNSSLVLRAEVRGRRILLPGDAEIDAQDDLLRSGADLRADVLKVPHHGSAYFERTFLAAVHAGVAVISVGAHNDYGHPAPSLLSALAELGVPTLRTDRDGDIAVAVQGTGLVTVHRAHRSAAGTRAPASMRPRTVGVLVDAAVSGRGDRMPTWSGRGTSSPRGAVHRVLMSSYSSVRRSSSSPGPSSRSPPPCLRTSLMPR